MRLISVISFQGETITILEMFRGHYQGNLDAATLRRYLAAPIAIRDRLEKRNRLNRLLAS